MGLEQNNEQHYRESPDKYHNPNANYQMTTRDYVLRPTADRDSGAITITLPPVADAKGRFYSLVCRGANATQYVTITDFDDSECWTDIVFNGKCDKALLYSDGLNWHALGTTVPCFLTTPAPGTTQPPTTAAPTLPPTTQE